jgi:hypothetical protein
MDQTLPTLDDDALLTAFEAGTLPPAAFGHHEHLRAGHTLLRRCGDLAAAALRFRTALRAFTARHGAGHRYHETITWAYLVLLQAAVRRRPGATFAELVAAEPDLLDHRTGALTRHYDLAALVACPIAREVFVLPEVR